MPQLDDRLRLQALNDSGLLRKDVTCRFDHLVFTAATLLRADVAELNVVTDEMQYTTAGWPPGGHDPRLIDDSGCRVVVEAQETVAIADVLMDPIMCEKSWAGEHRGYLGTPVMYRGQCIGTLCVLTYKTREWSHLDRRALEALADLASSSLDG
jgi:GAF domain-containing protein